MFLKDCDFFLAKGAGFLFQYGIYDGRPNWEALSPQNSSKHYLLDAVQQIDKTESLL